MDSQCKLGERLDIRKKKFDMGYGIYPLAIFERMFHVWPRFDISEAHKCP